MTNLTKNIWLIGAAAGFATVLLFVSSGLAAGGGLLGLFVPLPSLIAGLAWGWPVAGIAGLTGAVFFFVMTSGIGGLIYALLIAVPATLMAYVMGLWRPSGTDIRFIDGASQPPDAAVSTKPDRIEWYPLSRVLMWLVLLATVLAAFMTLSLGLDELKYRATVYEIMDDMIERRMEPMFQRQFTIEEKATLKERVALLLPAFVSSIWMLLMVLNTWLASRIARASSMLARPAPDLRMTGLARVIVLGLGAALLLTNLGGVPGRIAMGFVGAALFAILLIGLAVVHEWSIGNPARFVLLAGVYIGLLLASFLVLPALLLLGLAEPWLDLRARARARRQTPQGPPE
ncbi:MAG: hypothetical protein ACR2O4_18470 [Hyphomicrobiaceae bacterium]